MPIMNTGQFESYYKGLPGSIKEAADDMLTRSTYNDYVDEMSTQEYLIIMRELENAEAAGYWEEGSSRSLISPHEGFTMRLTQRSIGCMIDISKMLKKLCRSELLQARVKQMNRSMLKFVELIFTSFLEYGDVAVASVPLSGSTPIINSIGADGVTLFNTAHLWLSSNLTYANKSASYVDLTETGVDSVYVVVRGWADNTGDPLDHQLTNIMVPPNMRGKANKVYEARFEPATANNAPNIARGDGGYIKGKIIENQRFISTTNWYAMTDSDEAKIKAYWAWKNETDQDRNPITGNECLTLDSCLAAGAHRLRSFKVAA